MTKEEKPLCLADGVGVTIRFKSLSGRVGMFAKRWCSKQQRGNILLGRNKIQSTSLIFKYLETVLLPFGSAVFNNIWI